MVETSVQMANAALDMLGEAPINSFADASEAAVSCNAHYERTVLSVFAANSWRFARRRAALSIDASAETHPRFKNGFLMPSQDVERIGNPMAVWSTETVGATPSTRFEISDRWVYTDDPVCVIQYIRRVPESLWPSYFEDLVLHALCAALAMPITEIASRQQMHHEKAFGTPQERGRGGLMAVALAADLAGSRQDQIYSEEDHFGGVRFGDDGYGFGGLR